MSSLLCITLLILVIWFHLSLFLSNSERLCLLGSVFLVVFLFWLLTCVFFTLYLLICFSISCFRVDFIVYFILTCVYLVSCFVVSFACFLFLNFSIFCYLNMIYVRLFFAFALVSAHLSSLFSTNWFRMGRCFQMDAFTSVCMYAYVCFCLRIVYELLLTWDDMKYSLVDEVMILVLQQFFILLFASQISRF